jgi:hypothetical protein
MSAELLSIREDDLSTNAARDLLRLHLEGMHAHSPPSSVFALDFSGLSAPNVTVWTVWQGDEIAGIGAPGYGRKSPLTIPLDSGDPQAPRSQAR